jgi:GT2 family glycosyltransferase
MRNRLASLAETEWLLPLDDDDLLDPDCVETLLAHSEEADVVYPWCRVEGRDDFFVVNKLFHAPSLHLQNYIPVTALVRRDFWRMLAGYRPVPLEDWDMWRRAELHGGRFVCVPECLWNYRFIEGINEFQGVRAARVRPW